MATEQPKQSNEERALSVIDGSLENYRSEFVRLLGDAVDPEVFMSVAYEAFRSNRDLLEIALTAPDSLMKALHEAASLKLVPTGVLGSAYIVPRRNKTTGRREAYFQAGYRGLVELVMRSGHVSHCEARVVHEKDDFALTYGTQPGVQHNPFLDGDPGKVRGAYFVAFMRDGSTVVEYMSADQINAIRERSPAKNSGPWVTDYEEMCRKTVTRRGVKYLPMSVEVQRAVGLDDSAESDGEVVATVSAADAAPAKSLAGRIRQTMGQAEQIEQKPDQTADGPKNVTPSVEPSADQAPAAADHAEDAPQADEPPQEPPKARRSRKQPPKAEEAQAADPVASEPEASDDLPPEEPQPGPTEEAKKFGALAASSESWRGVLFLRGPETVAFRNDREDARWTGKLITEDADVQKFFDSLDEDRAYAVTIAGDLKLVPWERDGQSMPPFRQIAVKGVEVGAETDVPR